MNIYPARVLDDVQREAFKSFLDLARWMAAAIVFLGHLRNPLFFGYGDLVMADRTLPVLGWYFVTGWFGEAVIVFFVLSGYLVGGLTAAKLHVGKFSPIDYGIDRWTRIYVCFFPALALTGLLDIFGGSVFASTGLYNNAHPVMSVKLAMPAFTANMTLDIFVSNTLLLQNFLAPCFGSNQPLWSISAEFWFYVVFGLWLVAISSRTGVARFGAILLSAVIAFTLGGQFFVLMGLWLIGVATAFVPWRRAERPLLAMITFGFVLVVARLWHDSLAHSDVRVALRNYGVAAAFAWLLISMRHASASALVRTARWNRFMADFSFSLYLIHFPLMLFILGLFHATGYFDGISTAYSPRDPVGLILYVLIVFIVYAAAYLVSLVTERQVWKVRRWLKDVVARRGRAA